MYAVRILYIRYVDFVALRFDIFDIHSWAHDILPLKLLVTGYIFVLFY